MKELTPGKPITSDEPTQQGMMKKSFNRQDLQAGQITKAALPFAFGSVNPVILTKFDGFWSYWRDSWIELSSASL